MKVTAATITKAQLKELLAYARHIGDQQLATCAIRAIDGDSLYHRDFRERCAAAYAGAHMSAEFRGAIKFTADTITDEQIRELESDALARGTEAQKRKAVDLATRALAPRLTLVQSAKMTRGEIAAVAERRAKARARCAKVWHARHETLSSCKKGG